MKKSIVLAALSIFASAAFALSWSGIIENNTKVSTVDFSNATLDQSNGVYLSVNAPINKTLRFSGEALYKYNWNFTDSNNTFSNIADVDLLKLSGLWKLGTANLALDAGRFSISDLSGTVFSQCSDGVNVKYETAKWKAGLYAGYTGLLNSLNVSMTDTLSETHDFYSLAAAYIPVGVNYAYTSLLGSNVIGAQAYFFKAISDGFKDKIYGTVSLSGPVSTTGSYSTAAVLGVNDYNDFMLYAKADYSAFISNKGMVGTGIEYASGDQGPFKKFVTVTSKPVSCTGILTSGVIVPKLNAMFVNKNVFASLIEKVVITMPETEADFAGVDSTLTVLYNLFSDVQLGCDVMAFVGKESKSNKFSATVKATLAF